MSKPVQAEHKSGQMDEALEQMSGAFLSLEKSSSVPVRRVPCRGGNEPEAAELYEQNERMKGELEW